MKEKKIGIIASLIGIITLSLGGVITSSNVKKENNTIKEEANSSGLQADLKGNGIQLKLNARTNQGEYIVDTYSFTITPENATNQNVSATASYVDGSEYDNAVEVSVDNQTKTIELRVKELVGFDKQIKVVVVSESNPDVTATMTLDFTKKLVNASLGQSNFRLGYNQLEKATDVLNNFELEYSKYTIDETYSVSWDGKYEIGVNLSVTPNEVSETIRDIAGDLLTTILNENISVTAQYIWNFSNSNEWHSYLKTTTSETYIQTRAAKWGFKVTNSQGEVVKQVSDYTVAPRLYIGYDYSSAEFNVDVDSIVLENSNIIF